jgi:hypothetical protein
VRTLRRNKMTQNNWLKEPKEKKKKKRQYREDDNILEDGLKIGVGLIGLGIGLHVLKEGI